MQTITNAIIIWGDIQIETSKLRLGKPTSTKLFMCAISSATLNIIIQDTIMKYQPQTVAQNPAFDSSPECDLNFHFNVFHEHLWIA